MEKNLAAKASTDQALLTEAVVREVEKNLPARSTNEQTHRSEAVAQQPKVKPTFATITRTSPTTPNIKSAKTTNRPKPKQQFLAVVKPIEETGTSMETKAFVKKNVDITSTKISIKRVSNINHGGILIETNRENELNKLLNELETNDALNGKFMVGKPAKRNPQFIC
ncbi:hypothetical protein CDAR_397271 [Caerostris darwini]|uniref:Uncharacterized protein n=1 Tax=Caerostris darwini TaxID=1538125 RepID=A0AAV4PFM6_9ARAC|nr:hypothetical protein CDAR_397271 [Caerostris darwini]